MLQFQDMKRQTWLILAALVLVIVPIFAYAQGLVPCTGVTIEGDRSFTNCGFCELVQLVNRVVDWLIGVLSIIAAIMIAYSGFRLVTSGGNSGAKEEAKKMITNIVIGFVIVLAAWLLIDLMMQSLSGGQVNGRVWQEIQCADPVYSYERRNPITAAGSRYGTQSQYECAVNPDAVGTQDLFDCTGAAAQCAARPDSTATESEDGSTIICTTSGSGGSCEMPTDTSNACHPDNLTCFGDPSGASQVCSLESAGGDTQAESGSDLCQDGSSFSIGLWQINLLVNSQLIPGCSGAFNSNSQGSCLPGYTRQNSAGEPYCARWDCRVVDQTAYNACVAAAKNPETNTAAACSLYSTQGRNAWRTSANTCNVDM